MFRRKPKEIQFHKKRRAEKPELRAGSSLIIIVCVSAFLVAFALAMVYTGSMLMARANRRLEQERCYQLARSFAQVVDGELARYSGDDLEALAADGDYMDSFFRFSCRFLEEPAYQEYSPEHLDLTTYYYRPAIEDENYGKVTLILYKENDQETDVMEGMLSSNPAVGAGGGTTENPIETVMTNISRFTFHVEVVAELDGITYNYGASYDTQVQYTDKAVEFTAGNTRIYWDNTNRKWLDNNNNVYDVPDAASINYKINPKFSELKSYVFTRTIPEGGDGGP